MLHQKRVRLSLLVAGGVVVLGLVWLAITAFLARNALENLDDRYDRLRTLVAAGDLQQAREVARDIPDVAERAHDLTTGPAWWLAAQVPYLGEPIEVTRAIAATSGEVGTRVVPQLMNVAGSLDPATLRASGNTLKLAPLAGARGELAAAATSVTTAVAGLRDLPESTWLSPVDRGRARIATTLLSLRGYIDAAARVSRVLPEMLGSDRPQRYFIGLQNEAELRGTGGLPGAFAIAVANKGKLTFTNFESNARLDPPGPGNLLPTGLDFGPEYQAAYGAGLPTSSFVNSNFSPQFPYAAQIWAAMWQKVSGQRVDGVIALDPTSLAYFLAATGPSTVSGGITITAQNVVTLLQRDQYALFANNFLQRKQFVVNVLRSASKKLEAGGGSGLAILQAATRSAQEQRLLAWSRDPAIQRALVQTKYAGVLPPTDKPFAGVVVNNASGGKIDFYLTRSLDYARTGCGPTRDVLATIRLTNNAPASGLPAEVVGRADDPPPDAKPGDVHEIVDFIASRGATLLGVEVNGKQANAGQIDVVGRPGFRFDLQIPRGTTTTIDLHLREPGLAGTAEIWRQPGVTPLAVTSRQQMCR